MQAALTRTKGELATQRDSYEKASLDLKSAQDAALRAESDLRTTAAKLDQALNKSHKSGAVWETMMKGKQEREQEVAALKEEITALTLQRHTAGSRVDTLEKDKRDLQSEKALAHQRVWLVSLSFALAVPAMDSDACLGVIALANQLKMEP